MLNNSIKRLQIVVPIIFLSLFSTLILAQSTTVSAPVSKTSGTSNAVSSSVINSQIINETIITMSNSSRGDGINSSGGESSITNNNQISVQAFGTLLGGRGGDGIDSSGSQSIINNAVGAGITVGTTPITSRAGYAINVSGSGSKIENAGQISTGLGALGGINVNADSISLLNQAGGIISHAGIASSAIVVDSTNANIINQGEISVAGITAHGIRNNSSGLSLVNTGYILTQDSIPFIRNINQDIFGAFAIRNTGSIAKLVNAQGGDASQNNRIALTYNGNLPTQYEVIVTDPTRYGQLFVRNAGGAMSFLINDQTDLRKGTYSNVLVGIGSDNLTNSSGGYKGFTFRLVNNGDPDVRSLVWDLIVTGAYTLDTQQSLVNATQALQNIYTLQSSVLANSFTYDCNVFGANDVCVSAGGRNTAVSAANGLNNTSALLIAAYRPHPNYRIGAYADQNLSVNNAGSTVSLGNNTPLIGLFGAWNERLDGTGAEVKVSAAYGQKNTTVTRQVVGTSEAGSGSSQLNSQGAQVTAKYGFGVAEILILSPYVGVRYTQNNMGGYTEATSTSVTVPLTYSALNTNATTALAGIGANYKVIPTVTAFASAGVETDTNTSNGTYSATGIGGLTPVNFNPNPVRTRPTATVGAYYDIVKNQRLGIAGIYRQEAYQAVQTTTVMATYTVGM
jgi:uncharacterized protein YhjY with autotransporter beta-barrel domain